MRGARSVVFPDKTVVWITWMSDGQCIRTEKQKTWEGGVENPSEKPAQYEISTDLAPRINHTLLTLQNTWRG